MEVIAPVSSLPIQIEATAAAAWVVLGVTVALNFQPAADVLVIEARDRSPMSPSY